MVVGGVAILVVVDEHQHRHPLAQLQHRLGVVLELGRAVDDDEVQRRRQRVHRLPSPRSRRSAKRPVTGSAFAEDRQGRRHAR
jgi:hypothetical protein